MRKRRMERESQETCKPNGRSALVAETRGKCLPTAFLAGARPSMWLSDRLSAQLRHAQEHQFCLAHLIRDAQYAIDHGDTVFAPGFKTLLKDACAVGRRRPGLADARHPRSPRHPHGRRRHAVTGARQVG
jgi:hypothetical protein